MVMLCLHPLTHLISKLALSFPECASISTSSCPSSILGMMNNGTIRTDGGLSIAGCKRTDCLSAASLSTPQQGPPWSITQACCIPSYTWTV